MIKKTTSLIALACLLVTTGCSEVEKRASENVMAANANVDSRLAEIRAGRGKDISSVRYSDKVWLGSRGYRQQNGDPLPNKYDNITYMTSEPQTLTEIVSELSSMTGMRFVVRDAETTNSSSSSSESEASLLDAAMDISDSSSESLSTSDSNAITLTYSGDFVGLLNQLSTKFDVFWEHRENVIYLSKYVTRTLALYSLPSSTQLTSSIASESDSAAGGEGESSGGSQSGTTNNVELETSLNVWDEIDEVIGSMLPEGSTYAMSPSTGTLTITTSPLAVRKVENLIKKQNEIISRQVIIDVKVMSVTIDEKDSFELAFDSLLNNLSDNFNLGWSGPSGRLSTSGASGLGSFSPSYISDSGSNTIDLVANAISERFETSVVTNSTITTLNNHTVPLQIITRESYLKQIEQAVSDNGTISSAATPGDLTTGFVMNVLPRILSNGDIMMQYSMSLSENQGFEEIEFGDASAPSKIQLPTIVSRDFLQNIKLKSGNTLILAGYDRVLNSSEKAGVGRPDNFWLGGGKAGQSKREVLVIMVTPRIIQ